MTYQTIQQKKSFISLRYRTYSNSQNEYDVNNILLEKVNIPQLDEECEKINNSIIYVRRVQYELCLTYQQFTQCSLYENNEEKLSQAIVHLKSDLDFTENSTHCNVELFNRINEMCSDLIKSSDNLPNQLLSYIKNLLKYKSYFLSAVQFRFIQPINLQIDDSLKDESMINDQIDKIRTYRTNVNNSRIILNEIERLNQIVKCLFKNLIKSTANYLVSLNS
ncbi:hypothetical protein EWB00_006594 [Schistosoma japonicum]|uniref:Uncharacterized protein n=1 Tax=Schistosoma japonicum TaxID=6182 RepID=A0A4Z2CXP5_SCHJA|nr:hypothetical protein EWB00_006594 [Schistosoma japonicum]